MFFLTIFFNLISSYLIASIQGSFLVVLISFFAFVIINIEILSLFSAIKDVNLFIMSLFNLIFSFILFKFLKAKLYKFSFDFKRLFNSLLLDKSLIILSITFLILIFVSLFLSLTIPAIEPDAQTYHFIRAFEFFQNHNLNHFETNDVRSLVMPINSEIFYTFMLCFKKNFYGYGVLSFFSYILAILSLWNIFERFKFAYRKRLFAILIFSSFSAIILQIPSLQTDLVIGSLFLASFYFFILNKNCSLYFSSLCFALALGVKTTAIIFGAGYIFALILYQLMIEKGNFDKFKKFIIFLILNFIIFSSYNYILNIIQFHNPFGNEAIILSHKFWGGIKGFISNIIRYFFQSLDFSGFKWGYYLNNAIMGLENNVFDFLNIDSTVSQNVKQEIVNIALDEQTCGFGVLGFVLFLPYIFISIFNFFKNPKTNNNKTKLCFILSFSFLINIIFLSLSLAYMVYSIRFIVSIVAFCSIILVNCYFKKSLIKPFIIFFMVFYMGVTPFYNLRAPFFRIVDYLKKVNYDKEKLTLAFFEGKIIPTMTLSKDIINTIKEKYNDKNNIAIIKSDESTMLYLKLYELQNKNKKIDFLNAAKINYEKLKKYDLIILEDYFQKDNVFNLKDIKKTYEIIGNDVIFKTKKDLNCFYSPNSHVPKSKGDKNLTQRTCFSYNYIILDNDFILDYSEQLARKDKNDLAEILYILNNKSN